MYATSLGAEYDLITLQNEFDIEKPTWEQVRNAILALDGSNPNTIIIAKEYEEKERKGDTKDFMAIAGGGKNELYVCEICYNEGEWVELWLYDPSKSWDEEIEITRIFDETYRCHNLDTILVAAETYSRFGLRDTSFHWGDSPLREPERSQYRFIEIGPDEQIIGGVIQ